jgi:hypothetical protein|tara:strand:- start:320 stop:628 length:309 start_codon:yes stop_codon:yes gene_type:complete
MRVSELCGVSVSISLEIFAHSNLSLFQNIVNMANARKLFRLFKSLLEYKKINALLGKAESMPIHKFILALIPRLAFFCFWLFDHLVILTKIKVLNGMDAKWI